MSRRTERLGSWLLAALAVLALATLLLADPALAEALLQPWAGLGAASPPWHVVGLPQQTKPFTRFEVVGADGVRALRIDADASYGNLVHPLPPLGTPAQLAWQWRIERHLEASDLRERTGDDSEVRVCVFFDEPLADVPFVERQLLRVARMRSAELVPTATVCYVSSAQLPAGSVVPSPFTRRLRYFVLASGGERLKRWVAERRDLGADFERAFRAETRGVPPITGVAVGGDADNTRGHSVAYVAGLALEH